MFVYIYIYTFFLCILEKCIKHITLKGKYEIPFKSAVYPYLLAIDYRCQIFAYHGQPMETDSHREVPVDDCRTGHKDGEQGDSGQRGFSATAARHLRHRFGVQRCCPGIHRCCLSTHRYRSVVRQEVSPHPLLGAIEPGSVPRRTERFRSRTTDANCSADCFTLFRVNQN